MLLEYKIGVYKSVDWGDHKTLLQEHGISYRKSYLSLSDLHRLERGYLGVFPDKRLKCAKEAKELLDILRGVDIRSNNHILMLKTGDLSSLDLSDPLSCSLYYGVVYSGERGVEIEEYLRCYSRY